MNRTYYCGSCSTYYDEDHPHIYGNVCPLCDETLVCGLCLGKGEKKWTWHGVEGDADCICANDPMAEEAR